MSYRQAKPQEIADCIMRQEVEACDMAETEEYKNKPVKLRKLIRDIKICAVSNAHWVAAQRWGGPVNADLLAALRSAEAWVNQQGDMPGCRPAADSMLRVIRDALVDIETR